MQFQNNGHQNFRGDEKAHEIYIFLVGDANQRWKKQNKTLSSVIFVNGKCTIYLFHMT